MSLSINSLKVLFTISLLCIINNIGKSDSSNPNPSPNQKAIRDGEGKVGKYTFYVEYDRIFTSHVNLLYNFHITHSKMSNDGKKVFLFGNDRISEIGCKRAVLMNRDGSGIEEINLEYADCDPGLTSFDINYDGSIVFLAQQNQLVKYEDQQTQYVFNSEETPNEKLGIISQILCDHSGDNIYIRDFQSGIFRAGNQNPTGAEHIIEPTHVLPGGDTVSRFDGPMSITADADKILFFVTAYVGQQYLVNELFMLNGLTFYQMAKNNYGALVSAISGDGNVIVYRDSDGPVISQSEHTGGERIYLKNRFDGIASLDLSYDGSKLLYNEAYLVTTDGSEAVQINNLYNENLCLSDSGNIVGFHSTYYESGKTESCYYVGYMNEFGRVPNAPFIQNISLSSPIESNESKSYFTVTAEIGDRDGLQDIVSLESCLIDEDGLYSSLLPLNDDGYGGDDVAGDGFYKRNLWFDNYDSVTIRVQAKDKSGKITIAHAGFNIYPSTIDIEQKNQNIPYVLFYEQLNQQLNIQFEKMQAHVRLSVFNTNGQLLLQQAYKNEQQINCNIEQLLTGIYILQIDVVDNQFTDRIYKY